MAKGDDQLSLPEIIKRIKADDNYAQGVLYAYLRKECYPDIERHIIRLGGSKEDAEDGFQQAILALFAAITQGKFKLKELSFKSYSNQLGAFLMQVCKNLWRKELRWRNRPPIAKRETREELLIAEVPAYIVSEIYQNLGETCKNLLSMYFRDKLSPTLIAGKMKRPTKEVKKNLVICSDRMLKEIGSMLGDNQQEQLLELLNIGMEDMEERCKGILTAFYYEGKSMTEIAEKLGYANAHVVTEQKSRCMKRLNEAIVNRMLNDKKSQG